MIDVVFQKLNLFVLLDKQWSEDISISWQWAAAAGRPTLHFLRWTLLLSAARSTITYRKYKKLEG